MNRRDKPYRLGLYEKSMPENLSLRQKLEETDAAGYDYLELSIDETDEKLARLHWNAGEIASIYRCQMETGVFVGSICLSGHRRFPLGDPDPEVRQISLSMVDRAVVLAARLGVRLIQLAGYDVYYKPSSDETRVFFEEGLRRSVNMAAREGVTLAFETMETPFLNTVEKGMVWLRKVPSPYLHLYPDIGNLTNAAVSYGTNVLTDLTQGRGHLAALHLKETRPGVYRELAYGEGHVDFSAAVETAMAMGVRRFVGEFWYNGGDWRKILRDNCVFLRRCCEERG